MLTSRESTYLDLLAAARSPAERAHCLALLASHYAGIGESGLGLEAAEAALREHAGSREARQTLGEILWRAYQDPIGAQQTLARLPRVPDYWDGAADLLRGEIALDESRFEDAGRHLLRSLDFPPARPSEACPRLLLVRALIDKQLVMKVCASYLAQVKVRVEAIGADQNYLDTVQRLICRVNNE